MGIVIGSQDASDWYTATMLRGSIQYMRDKDPKRFESAISKNKTVLSGIMDIFTKEFKIASQQIEEVA